MPWTNHEKPAEDADPAQASPDRDPKSRRPRQPRSLDPYYRWAKASAWRGLVRFTGRREPAAGSDAEEPTLRIIARLPDKLDAAQRAAILRDERWTVPPVYGQPVPSSAAGPGRFSRHFTAEVKWSQRAWLESNPHGIAWELAVPFRDAESTARANPIGLHGEMDKDDFRTRIHLEAPARPKKKAAAAEPLTSAIAVIDFGCPFLNQRFDHAERDTAGTRVARLWDQGSARHTHKPFSDHWQPETGLGYGSQLSPPAMDALWRCARDSTAATRYDESEIYRGIDYLIAYDDARRRVWGATHGGHVLDVAGGTRDPLTGEADAASRAPLVFVQLPALTAADSSGGSLSAQLLDGLRYVLAACTRDAPVVVNISYGSFAGPHDGSSMIEQAMDELLELRPTNFAIVLAAGNSRNAQCHVSRRVAPGRSARLRVDLAAGDTTDTFVEIWYPRRKAKQAPLQVRVQTAGRDWSDWVSPGGSACLFPPCLPGQPSAMLQHEREVPSGARSLILLALAPTRQPADDDGPLAEAGAWEIEIRLDPAAIDGGQAEPVQVEAWIERDDPGDFGAGTQSRFIDNRIGDNEETLSSIATGRHTIVVGGFRRSDAQPLPYSSTGVHKRPSLLAACEEDDQQTGIRAAAVRSSESFLMNGTSVAAPVVARRLYNTLMQAKRPRVAYDGWKRVFARLIEQEGRSPEGAALQATALDEQPG